MKRTETLYDGTITIEFDSDLHRYKKDGKTLVSVTAATGVIDKSQPLILWAVGLAKEYLYERINNMETIDALEIETACALHKERKEKAADTGSQVHNWIEAFAKAKRDGTETPVIPENKNVQNGVNAFLDWFIENDVVFETNERLVYSRAHDYVGITDFVAVVNGRRVVGDWKTSKRIYPEMRAQLAAYWGAIQEEEGRGLEGGILLHCDKETGEFGVVEITPEEFKELYPVFLSCLNIKKWLKTQS